MSDAVKPPEALARLIRQRLESAIPVAFGRLAHLAGEFRRKVQDALPTTRQRLRYWDEVLDRHAGDLAMHGRTTEARTEMDLLLSRTATDNTAAAIENGTLPTERRCFATLSTLASRAAAELGDGPTLVIIGHVINHRPHETYSHDEFKAFVGRPSPLGERRHHFAGQHQRLDREHSCNH